ncbi:MAG: hypothetical protein ABIO46_12935 [Chitinophagales bacterium]
MKLAHCLLPLFLLLLFAGGCKKSIDAPASSEFVRIFPSDSSYYTGGAFQLPDGNFVIYGFPPENNELPPLVIKCDLRGNVLWKKRLPSGFHYCNIKVCKAKTMMAVGVASSISSIINVCEINDSTGEVMEGTLREYPVGNVRSGPLNPPEFVMNSTGDLVLIAGSINLDNSLFPFALSIDAAGMQHLVNLDLSGVTALMTRGLSSDSEGFTISGSTYKTDASDTSHLVTFCLRLNTDFEKEWDTILSFPEGSLTSKGITETASSIIIYGSKNTGTYNNSTIGDMPGTLYTQQIDKSGKPGDLKTYSEYENLAHAGELIKTSDGFIMSATTNELLDLYLVSSNRMYLLKLDDSLNYQWHREFNGFFAFTAVSVFETQDGGYLIGGYEHSGTFFYSMCMIKTDAYGNIVLE